MTLDQLQAFIQDHQGHELSFEQEFIQCLDCDETFTLPEGAIVYLQSLEDEMVFIEVPGSEITLYTIYLVDGMVSL